LADLKIQQMRRQPMFRLWEKASREPEALQAIPADRARTQVSAAICLRAPKVVANGRIAGRRLAGNAA